MVDAVAKRVLEALVLDGARGADAPSHVDAGTIAREEQSGRFVCAAAPGHPVHVIDPSIASDL
jgi:hypothetical protein